MAVYGLLQRENGPVGLSVDSCPAAAVVASDEFTNANGITRLAAENVAGVLFNIAEACCPAEGRTWRLPVNFDPLAKGLPSGNTELTEPSLVVDRRRHRWSGIQEVALCLELG